MRCRSPCPSPTSHAPRGIGKPLRRPIDRGLRGSMSSRLALGANGARHPYAGGLILLLRALMRHVSGTTPRPLGDRGTLLVVVVLVRDQAPRCWHSSACSILSHFASIQAFEIRFCKKPVPACQVMRGYGYREIWSDQDWQGSWDEAWSSSWNTPWQSDAWGKDSWWADDWSPAGAADGAAIGVASRSGST